MTLRAYHQIRILQGRNKFAIFWELLNLDLNVINGLTMYLL